VGGSWVTEGMSLKGIVKLHYYIKCIFNIFYILSSNIAYSILFWSSFPPITLLNFSESQFELFLFCFLFFNLLPDLIIY
jgi:hypothetical protein